MENSKTEFKPYISASQSVPEFTLKAILLGSMFGIIFGASTVFLALKAGLTVSASIPIAVLAISLGRKFFKTTILENNIIQTTGSAGESIASGVVFTLPAFLFLSANESGISSGNVYFQYWTIFTLAVLGGMLGTLMMIPLRRSLIVKEHGQLPYPEGTACAQVLIAGEKGGDFAKTAYQGLGFAMIYAILQRVLHVISETPAWVTKQSNRFFPSATLNGDITPEYLGVGYIIGPRIAGVLVAGGVLAWLGLIPLLASIVPADTIALQQVKLGFMKDLLTAGGKGGWDPATHTFSDMAEAIYRTYVRQIGAGAVAAGGFITLIKTIPTIISSFRESISSMKEAKGKEVARTENDLSFKTVIIGSLALVVLMTVLPMLPGDSIFNKFLIGILIVVFGFFFVTVSSRIVGIIGSSNNPISGMTIATIMGTALIFIAVGWTGKVFEPMALVVGGIVCIAAANAGATSQDLKTGYIIGSTPRYQQLALFIGAIVSSIVIGVTVKYLDTPTPDLVARGIQHAIGEKFAAPQATLMATLIKGLLSFNLDWNFVLVGVFLAITVELCGVKSLSFAVGAYLPLSTTLPIFAGGAIKGLVDWRASKRKESVEDAELGKGSLFATGLVAGGALFGVIVAVLSVNENVFNQLEKINTSHRLMSMFGEGGYMLLGAGFFAFMGWVLYRVAIRK
ncbi:MAG: oligopeptide transporter, OPT family [Bacteroidetes bacterium]|nr:oligopeptide transporter, OPT family [Bacteroidota bacterium]